PATTLIASIREHCGNDVDIVLVIGAADRAAFAEVAAEHACRLLEIEDLIFEYTGRRIEGSRLLSAVDRFRFQTMKKFLGVASLSGDVFIMDSETIVTRDLAPIFEGGIAETSVVYSERPWKTMNPSLTTHVYEECCELLEPQPYWYFESFNWLYSSDLLREMLAHLKAKHGVEWVFRARPLFECQLYFQYAHSRGANYRFITAHDVLAVHFGEERAASVLRAFFTSPLAAFGVFEYLARFVSQDEYLRFTGKPEVLKHFRLMRHEPYAFYDIVGQVRKVAGGDPNYFGEASMHRRPLLYGRIAVIASGKFHHEEDAHNLRHFLRGVECDLFLGLGADTWPDATAQEVLQPCRVARVDDAASLDRRRGALQAGRGVPESRTKPDRDVGSMAMFEKMAAAWGALLEQEAVRGERYSLVVRVRPDMFAVRGLHDILWEITEHMGSLKGSVFVPDRFWSQGINDQLFLGLREEMGRLLDGIDSHAYAACHFRNPEYFVGTLVSGAGLSPVPFPYEYILTRGDQPKLNDIEYRLDVQSRNFWSAKIALPPWKGAGVALDEILANVRVKNGLMNPEVVPTPRGYEADVVFAHDAGGGPYVLVSEHKSPAVFMRKLPRGAGSFVPVMVAAGLLMPGSGQAVRLESFDEATGRIELTPSGAQQTLTLQLAPPPRSGLLALRRLSLRGAGLLYRTARSRAQQLRRSARDLRAWWKVSNPSGDSRNAR
ncbi:MAG: hypothetical protein JWN34_4476, partial [Bryobacterales bacterium]|nr:hypothetical protein [Bryobacterales bacterium]